MFVQMIQGQVSDVGKARAALDRWVQELAPGAAGWLGSTAGVTDDGTFLALVRFESEEAARRNSDRPEQGQWWEETSRLFSGGATFSESSDVIVDITGEPDQAGFVQVMRGGVRDPDRARVLMAQDPDKWAAFRPDIVGSVTALHGDGTYAMAMYFTSEEQAREGERKQPPPELKAQMDEMNAMSVGAPEFFDLKQPWMYSPR